MSKRVKEEGEREGQVEIGVQEERWCVCACTCVCAPTRVCEGRRLAQAGVR